jgi:hypothetical protein
LSGDIDRNDLLSANGLWMEGLRERSFTGDLMPDPLEFELDPLLFDSTDLERLLREPTDPGLGLDGAELELFDDDDEEDDESESAIVQIGLEIKG